MKKQEWLKRMSDTPPPDESAQTADNAISEVVYVAASDAPPSKNFTKKYRIDVVERERLSTQNNLLVAIDQAILDRFTSKKSNLALLDIGCQDGRHLKSLCEGKKQYSKILGIDINQDSIEKAQSSFDDGKAAFEVMDCDSSDFEKNLKAFMAGNDIQSLDVITISMVVLHLKYPSKMLYVLSKFLKKGGFVYVRDIDDGLNIVYPDRNNLFNKIYEIIDYADITGNRKTGRAIFGLLARYFAGNVRMEFSGINSVGKSSDERKMLYELYFSAFYDLVKRMQAIYPDDARVKEYLRWANENIDEIETQFFSPDTFIQLGFVGFTADKN